MITKTIAIAKAECANWMPGNLCCDLDGKPCLLVKGEECQYFDRIVMPAAARKKNCGL